MPSRIYTVGILAFWLIMTGWLIEREVVPMMLADASPTYQPDLTDELGSPLISWQIYDGDKRIGHASSRVIGKENRIFELHSDFHFDRATMPIKQVESMDRVTEDGKLLALSIKFVLANDDTGEITGQVVNKTMEPHVFYNEKEQKLFELGKIDMAEQGSIVNPMTLVNRLRGLRVGQTWKIVMFDPFRGLKLKPAAAPPSLIARVETDTLHWNGKEVACLKIEYHEAGKEGEHPAATWVRRSDGLVLRHACSYLGTKMALQRVP